LRRGPLLITDALHIARQVIAGLRAAHARGIIHRDLKPSNIKMTPEGTVKLVDFGIAKVISDRSTWMKSFHDVSRVGVVVGTVAYMSPEQARGKPVDVRTDVWAFGCVLYEMLTGRAAFRGDSPTDIVVKIATEDPDWTSIGSIARPDSPDLQRLMRKCLQKDPNMRYGSVGEIAGYLEAVGSDSGGAVIAQPAAGSTTDEEHFSLPRGPALPLFMFAQVGYLALYGTTLYLFDSVARILADDFLVPETYALIVPAILAMCGIAIRIYLISAVGWRHPLAGGNSRCCFHCC
jgi:serine/threonine protein kinase